MEREREGAWVTGLGWRRRLIFMCIRSGAVKVLPLVFRRVRVRMCQDNGACVQDYIRFSLYPIDVIIIWRS